MLAGKQSFADTLKNAENPMIIVGQGALTRDDGAAVLASAIELAEKTGASFNMLHTAAARVAGLDLGLVPGEGGFDVAAMQEAAQSGALENVILYGADEIAGASLGMPLSFISAVMAIAARIALTLFCRPPLIRKNKRLM